MPNIFSDMGNDEIFKDERVLMPEFLPEELPCRETEIREIAFALKAAGQGRKPENVVLVGRPGTGKTAAAKFVLRQLGEYSSRVSTFYINCWEFSTRHAVLSQIAFLLGVFMPRRGIAADEILARSVEVMKKEKKVVIIVLDEIDRLLAGRNEEERVLYDLLRAGEMHGVFFGVVGITNNEDFLAKLDSRIRSSLGQKEVKFAPYTPQQLKMILGERTKLAFMPNAVDEEVVPVCAANAGKNGGDARLGIAMLWKSGKAAEREGAKTVSVAHCKKAFASAEGEVREQKLGGLSKIEKRIIELAKDGIQSGELYEKLAKEFEETDRTVRNYVEKLETLKLISVEDKEREKGGKGNTRIIRAEI